MAANRTVSLSLAIGLLAVTASLNCALPEEPTVQAAVIPLAAVQPAPVAPVSDKLIALTFDDGPHETRTVKILDELRRRQVKATFFVVGYRVVRYPELVRRMAAEGHEVGNHTWNHPFLTRISDAAVLRQIERTQAAVEMATGQRPIVMRPPFGAISPRVQRQLALPAILWSVESRDYIVRQPEAIFRQVIGQARPGGIILCHDFWSAPAVGRIVDRLTEQGYRFVTVSELLGFADGSVEPVSGRTYWRQPAANRQPNGRR